MHKLYRFCNEASFNCTTMFSSVFQEGSSDQLYESVHSQASVLHSIGKWFIFSRTLFKRFCFFFYQIFTLPKDTLIYPAHDYKGFEVMQNANSFTLACLMENMTHPRNGFYIVSVKIQVSTVGEEMQHNPRLTKDKETFKTIMSSKFLLLSMMLKYSSSHK